MTSAENYEEAIITGEVLDPLVPGDYSALDVIGDGTGYSGNDGGQPEVVSFVPHSGLLGSTMVARNPDGHYLYLCHGADVDLSFIDEIEPAPQIQIEGEIE